MDIRISGPTYHRHRYHHPYLPPRPNTLALPPRDTTFTYPTRHQPVSVLRLNTSPPPLQDATSGLRPTSPYPTACNPPLRPQENDHRLLPLRPTRAVFLNVRTSPSYHHHHYHHYHHPAWTKVQTQRSWTLLYDPVDKP